METLMDEQEYERLAADTFHRVLDLFEGADPELADVEHSGDVLTIDLAGQKRIVLNTQRPTRQLWLAGGQRAWHFSYDRASGGWMDDRGSGEELLAVLTNLATTAGVEL